MPRKRKAPDELRVPQVRILSALMPIHNNDPKSEWPLLNRLAMSIRAGYAPPSKCGVMSGTVTRALMGIKEGSSSGDPHLGLIALEYLEVIEVNIDGIRETNYRITSRGISAFNQYVRDGGRIPDVRKPEAHTNVRYIKEG